MSNVHAFITLKYQKMTLLSMNRNNDVFFLKLHHSKNYRLWPTYVQLLHKYRISGILVYKLHWTQTCDKLGTVLSGI